MRYRCRYVGAALALGLLGPLAGFGQVKPPQMPTQKSPFPLPTGVKFPVTLPCFLWHGLPMVTGGVNEKPQQFIVDTGLNAVTVSQKVQAALSLPLTKSRYRVIALDYASDVPAVTLQDISLGQMVFLKVEATVMNVGSMLSPHAPPDSPQCWLGTPLLSAFQITLDTKNHACLLDSPKADAPKSDDALTLPLTMKSGRIFARLTAPGAKPFLMLIDTGSPASILPLTTFDKLKLKPFKIQIIRLANRRNARAAQVVLPELLLGGASLKNLSVVSIAPDDPKDFDPDFGLLGMDILGRYRITINYARLKMTLIPYPEPPAIK